MKRKTPPLQDWEKARRDWAMAQSKVITPNQRKRMNELRELKIFNEIEILYHVFGWRSPIAQAVWVGPAQRQVPLGLNEAVTYLLRVVLGIPTDKTHPKLSLNPETKGQIVSLLLDGITNRHVVTKGSDHAQSARSAINEVLGKLKIKTRLQDEEIDDLT